MKKFFVTLLSVLLLSSNAMAGGTPIANSIVGLGTNINPVVAAGGTFKVKHGTYTGTGSALSITGLGFQPKFVVLYSGVGSGSPITAWDGFNGVSNSGFGMDSATVAGTNYVTAYGVDGFTLGTDADVNTSARVYYYTALGGDATQIAVGTYTGNSLDNRDITVGFAPDMVIVKSSGDVSTPRYRLSSVTGDQATSWGGNAAYAANVIQAFGATTFQVGTDSAVNQVASSYSYFALKIPAGYGETGTYTGNSSDNRTINYADGALVANALLVKGFDSSFSNAPLLMKGTALTGDNATGLANGYGNLTNRLQLMSTGSFQVGSDDNANRNTTPFHYIALKISIGAFMDLIFKIFLSKLNGLIHASRGSDIGGKEKGLMEIQYGKEWVFLFMAVNVGIATNCFIPILPFYICFWLFWANIGKNMQTIFCVPQLANEAELTIFDWPTDQIFGKVETPEDAGAKMTFFSFLYSSQFYLYFVIIAAIKYYMYGSALPTLLFGLTVFGWCIILRLIRIFKGSFKTWRVAEDLTGTYFSFIAITGWLV